MNSEQLELELEQTRVIKNYSTALVDQDRNPKKDLDKVHEKLTARRLLESIGMPWADIINWRTARSDIHCHSPPEKIKEAISEGASLQREAQRAHEKLDIFKKLSPPLADRSVISKALNFVVGLPRMVAQLREIETKAIEGRTLVFVFLSLISFVSKEVFTYRRERRTLWDFHTRFRT